MGSFSSSSGGTTCFGRDYTGLHRNDIRIPGEYWTRMSRLKNKILSTYYVVLFSSRSSLIDWVQSDTPMPVQCNKMTRNLRDSNFTLTLLLHMFHVILMFFDMFILDKNNNSNNNPYFIISIRIIYTFIKRYLYDN